MIKCAFWKIQPANVEDGLKENYERHGNEFRGSGSFQARTEGLTE